jgi:arginyl-tRNA synthetase
MAARFRHLAGSQSAAALRTLHRDFDGSARALAGALRLHWDRRETVSLALPAACLPGQDPAFLSSYLRALHLGPGLRGAALTPDSKRVLFLLDTKQLVAEVLQATIGRQAGHDWTGNALFEAEKRDVVVEFSSPNIAKPFHVGHLRSTILGNFVARMQELAGHRVTRLCYLGDWGGQFGLLLAGLARRGLSVEEVAAGPRPVDRLLEVYIEANQLAAQEPEFALEARAATGQLEAGHGPSLQAWRAARDLSLADLQRSYRRLGVTFDHFHGESQYSGGPAEEVVQLLEAAGLLELEADGRRVVRADNGQAVTVVKSDGSSLYLSRDLAAALDRHKQFRFDRMFYVVDNSQEPHFRHLFQVLGRLGHRWAAGCQQVRFGKILGMSTRKGNVVRLDALLDEAKAVMLSSQQRSANTRVPAGQEEAVAEAMALSALVTLDLGKRRTKDYKFSWEVALSSTGDTGVKLQYNHARLHSLLAACSAELGPPDPEAATDLLVEPVALELVILLGQWDEVLAAAATSLEPHRLVGHLFAVANCTSRALTRLPVRGLGAEERGAARARLLLFAASQRVLAEGLTLMGLTPLDHV